jgi:type II secretory pathway pseudopilin PulG
VSGNDPKGPALRRLSVCRRRRSIRSQEGFTYIGVLLAVGLIGIQLALAGVVWSFAQTRQKERELLFVGGQFRTAISQYYLNPKGPQKEYPRRLEDLLKDPRYPGTIRHLRKIYADPITGKKRWGLVRLPNGGIIGVYSLSDQAPIKTGNFRPADLPFTNKHRYADWKFVHAFGAQGVAAPGAPGTQGAAGAQGTIGSQGAAGPPPSGISSESSVYDGEENKK